MEYYFIGIKGSGMASLATIVFDRHEQVSGSDIDKYIFTQKPLEERHIPIYHFDENNIKEGMTIIIGNAFNESNPEVKKAMELAKQGKVQVYWYHDFLGQLVEEYTSISVAGTHGKTTTTGMISHVMAEVAPTGFLIGDGTGDMPDDGEYFVLESCEYQRHFLAYKPQYAIITNIELDHVDYYKNMEDYRDAFETFANQVKKGIVLFGDDEEVRRLHVKTKHLYYGLQDDNDVQAVHVIQNEEGMSFDVLYKKAYFGSFKLPFVGKPLLWNSLGVIALGIMEGLQPAVLQEGLASFPGVKRRFTIEEKNGNVYIDDYAHHPTEIEATLNAAHNYPHNKVWCVFQPHTYTRTKALLPEFAKALTLADHVVVADIYAARETDDLGISSADLQKRIQELGTPCEYFPTFDEIENFLLSNCQEGDLLITMGAGDVVTIGEQLLGK